MLDSSRLTFQPYADGCVKNSPGFPVSTSGQLLIATDKGSGKKYLVMHTHPHKAANEYVACWLAEKLGVIAPRAWLLSPSKVFESKYAVAIEFIDGLTGVDKTSVPEELQTELITQFAFHALIGSDDVMQLGTDGRHIYSYDFTEAFCFINDMVFTILRSKNHYGTEMLKQKLAAFRQYLNHLNFSFPSLAREFHLDLETQTTGMIETAKKILNITEAEIGSLSDELTVLFPASIAVFYEECMKSMQDRMNRI